MKTSNTLGGLAVASALALAQCGGKAELPFEPEVQSGSGGAPADDCTDDASFGGCPDAGAGPGADPLEAYARARTACGRNVTVNRTGPPASICPHIK